MPVLSEFYQTLTNEMMTQIANQYRNLFPMEIRYHCSKFLESRLFCVFVPDESDPQLERDANTFLNDFIFELEKEADEINDYFQLSLKTRLVEAANLLRTQNSIAVYSHLIRCMDFEQQMFEFAQSNTMNEVHQDTQKLNHDIGILLTAIRQCKDLQWAWIKKDESQRLESHEINHENDDESSQADVDILVRQLRQESLEMLQKRANEDCVKLIESLREIVAACNDLTSRVVDNYLKNWKRYQKYDGINVAINGADLDAIQSWCEKLAESLWFTREQIRLTQEYQSQLGENELGLLAILPGLQNEVSSILFKLINGSFIIEKQPPQVMRKNTKFQASLRLLVGNVLGLKLNFPVVSTKIVSETQAQRIFQTNTFSGNSCGDIINGRKHFEFTEATRHMTVNFENLKLDRFKRSRKCAENVTDEKFALFFETTLFISDFQMKISTMSLPMVVIVHNSQESLAYATIFWDNSFSDIDRNPFVVLDQVPWKKFAEALNQKCIKYTERALSPENIINLAEKIFKMQFHNGVPDDLNVSWNAFCKENIQDRNFSFWDWFHAALKLIRDHLRGPWIEGSVVGFMSKLVVEEYLKFSSHGTFLLRFSDSEPGAISIAWLKNKGYPHVLHIQPFNSRDLTARSLSDRLSDLEELKFAYPTKPKSEAFDHFRSVEGKPQPSKIRRPYVPTVMKLVVFEDNQNL